MSFTGAGCCAAEVVGSRLNVFLPSQDCYCGWIERSLTWGEDKMYLWEGRRESFLWPCVTWPYTQLFLSQGEAYCCFHGSACLGKEEGHRKVTAEAGSNSRSPGWVIHWADNPVDVCLGWGPVLIWMLTAWWQQQRESKLRSREGEPWNDAPKWWLTCLWHHTPKA